MRGADIGSDHHLLVGKDKINLKVWKFVLQGGKANEVPSQPITGPRETTGIPPRTEKHDLSTWVLLKM